jgi:hypothetical protein
VRVRGPPTQRAHRGRKELLAWRVVSERVTNLTNESKVKTLSKESVEANVPSLQSKERSHQRGRRPILTAPAPPQGVGPLVQLVLSCRPGMALFTWHVRARPLALSRRRRALPVWMAHVLASCSIRLCLLEIELFLDAGWVAREGAAVVEGPDLGRCDFGIVTLVGGWVDGVVVGLYWCGWAASR